MAVLLITYDITDATQKNSSFYNEVQNYYHVKLSPSSYAIYTNQPAAYVYKKLRPSLEKDDRLYIFSLDKPWAGYGPEKNKNWLINYL